MGGPTGNRLLFGGLAIVIAGAIAFGVLQERKEQKPESKGSKSPPPAAPAVDPAAPPSFAKTPSASDPSPDVLLEKFCGEEKSDCACREQAITHAFSLSLGNVSKQLVESAQGNCAATLKKQGLAPEAYARASALSKAQRALDALLLQDPKNPHGLFAVALMHLHKDQLKLAEEAAQRALKLGRGAPAHTLLGVLAVKNRDAEGAVSEFDRAIELDPNDVEAHFNRAVLAEKRDGYNDARKGYLKTLAIRPGHSDSRYALARLTFSAGAVDEARHHLRKLQQIAPDDSRIPGLAEHLRGKQSETSIQGKVASPDR